jgi:GNAT superfamily N-acetyltransferase
MSLWSEYLLEKEGKKTIETDHGFITYFMDGDHMHVDILFVAKNVRRAGFGEQLFIRACESESPKSASAAVDTAQLNPTGPLHSFLNYGFKLAGVRGTEILLYKDLK